MTLKKSSPTQRKESEKVKFFEKHNIYNEPLNFYVFQQNLHFYMRHRILERPFNPPPFSVGVCLKLEFLPQTFINHFSQVK